MENNSEGLIAGILETKHDLFTELQFWWKKIRNSGRSKKSKGDLLPDLEPTAAASRMTSGIYWQHKIELVASILIAQPSNRFKS